MCPESGRLFVKHCPNPACSGLDKFGAVSEFNDAAEVCSDCGGRLVLADFLAPTRADSE